MPLSLVDLNLNFPGIGLFLKRDAIFIYLALSNFAF